MRIEDIELLAPLAGLAKWARDTAGNLRGLMMGGKRIIIPYVLSQSAVPVILAPNGTVAADGTITLGTALTTVFSGGAWLRLPAGAVVGGASGLYWAIFSSTTVGSVRAVYVDPAQPFTPYVPTGTPAAAVGSGAAYTQTSGVEITLVNITIPGKAIGENGSWRLVDTSASSNSANQKILQWRLGPGGTFVYRPTTITQYSQNIQLIRNRGRADRQVAFTPGYIGGVSTSSTTSAYTSIDTSVDQTLVCLATLPAADAGAAYVIVEGFTLEVIPG